MKVKNIFKTIFVFTSMLLISNKLTAQNLDKILFVKPVPVKFKSAKTYSFMVGYVATANRDLALDFSGGPAKFWVSKTVKVNKGQGIIEIKLNLPEPPVIGNDYRLILSIRKRNGGWKTTIAGSSISNIEIVSEDVKFADNASFSPITPNSLESADVYSFEVDYNVSQENLIQVSIWNGNNWLASSQRVKVLPGKGVQKVKVSLTPPTEASTYKLMLTFGTADDFKNKKTRSKDLSGIRITKPEKQLTIKEINDKSVQISVNKESEILILPGAPLFDYIRIISMSGQIVLESKSSNSIKISTLPQGAYFAITSNNDYYKFVKF